MNEWTRLINFFVSTDLIDLQLKKFGKELKNFHTDINSIYWHTYPNIAHIPNRIMLSTIHLSVNWYYKMFYFKTDNQGQLNFSDKSDFKFCVPNKIYHTRLI